MIFNKEKRLVNTERAQKIVDQMPLEEKVYLYERKCI